MLKAGSAEPDARVVGYAPFLLRYAQKVLGQPAAAAVVMEGADGIHARRKFIKRDSEQVERHLRSERFQPDILVSERRAVWEAVGPVIQGNAQVSVSPFQAKGNCDLSCLGVLLGLRSLPCTQTQGAKDQGQRTQPQALPASGAMPKGSTAGDQLGSLRGYTVLFHPSFPVLIARAGSPQDLAKARGLHDRAQHRRGNSTAEGKPVHGVFSLPQKAAFVSIITHRQSQANHCKINSACTRSVWR